MPSQESPIQPLSETRVLDLSQNLAGPYAAQILADLGADVIKIEPPGGDPARAWGPPFIGGQSPLFQAANRNKRSLCLDLKTPADRHTLHEMAADCDVFLQAYRMGVPERLGVDYPTIRAIRPEVIYASVTAFGTEGPLREAPGYDPLLQARSGLMSITGEPDGPPSRVGASVVDLGTGMWTAIGILGALRERDRTGCGCHVQSSLLDTSLAWMSYHLTSFLATGTVPGRQGTSIAMIAPYQAFPCADGEVMIAAGNDGIFQRLCEALDLPMATDPDFGTNEARVAHRPRLVAKLAEATRPHTVAELIDLLGRHRVPCAPIHDVAAAVSDPQSRSTGMLRPAHHPEADSYVDVALPIRWDGQRAPFRYPPPGVDGHRNELLSPEED
ncbi:MAG: CoA transferase [Gemmatimonadetes bacterium]|nr:CoA transferase [Gemmatimonadota bacterium]